MNNIFINIAKKNKWLILVLFIYLSPCLLLITVELLNANFYEAFKTILHALVALFLLFIPLIIFNFRLKYYFISISPFFALIPAILFGLAIYGRMPTKSIIAILFNSNWQEIHEFTREMYFWKILAVILPISVLYISIKFLPLYLEIKYSFKLFFIGTGIFLFLVVFCFKSIQRQGFEGTINATFKAIIKDTPISFSVRFYRALKNEKLERNIPISSAQSLKINRNFQTELREIYILLLGESSRYDHWNINGYQRNTSPKINTLSNMVSYSNVISPSFLTQYSVPMIITNSNKSDSLNLLYQYSLPTYFKAAGFKTYWISNQNSRGSIVGKLAVQSDFYFEEEPKNQPIYDEFLLEQLKQIVLKNEQKVFIVLHMMGSHYPYQNRYPDSYIKFSPDVPKNKHIILGYKKKKQIINSYDNSVLFTDNIIYSAIRAIDKDSTIAAMVYLSDHGENLFDNNNVGFGRGFVNPSPNLFHIPLFIWYSDLYKEHNQEQCTLIRTNKDYKFSLEDFCISFLDIANFELCDSLHQKSFFNENYKTRKRTILLKNRRINYDLYFNQ